MGQEEVVGQRCSVSGGVFVVWQARRDITHTNQSDRWLLFLRDKSFNAPTFSVQI